MQERTYIRDLARRYVDICRRPEQAQRRQLWRRHNSLRQTRPPIYIRAFAWHEMPDSQPRCQDPLWRQMEDFFRRHLFWDRLPMTIAFMALFYAILADRVGGIAERYRWLLPLLVAAGFASLLYWDWTESLGRGDLRFYALVQFYPMLALPVICWLFSKARYTGGGYLIWVIFWYAAAKGLEHFDGEVFALLGHTVSGHSLKHLASAMATFMLWRMVVGNGSQRHR
ncbi:MAG: hypothetical protein HOC05_00550 [Gemmatimonadetes bacterium]|nr:hypothetical protein [Gemmatimonadota bacterium]